MRLLRDRRKSRTIACIVKIGMGAARRGAGVATSRLSLIFIDYVKEFLYKSS